MTAGGGTSVSGGMAVRSVDHKNPLYLEQRNPHWFRTQQVKCGLRYLQTSLPAPGRGLDARLIRVPWLQGCRKPPAEGIPGTHDKQADILPYKASHTVTTFGCYNILGHLEHDKRPGHLFARNIFVAAEGWLLFAPYTCCSHCCDQCVNITHNPCLSHHASGAHSPLMRNGACAFCIMLGKKFAILLPVIAAYAFFSYTVTCTHAWVLPNYSSQIWGLWTYISM